mmetsp:Transcript_10080/g.13208  ORF Transcript_10080/g.13208 Transcript_10080/m.13208 type:complete len:221 (+) Transcript_10080:938-1600(+)
MLSLFLVRILGSRRNFPPFLVLGLVHVVFITIIIALTGLSFFLPFLQGCYLFMIILTVQGLGAVCFLFLRSKLTVYIIFVIIAAENIKFCLRFLLLRGFLSLLFLFKQLLLVFFLCFNLSFAFFLCFQLFFSVLPLCLPSQFACAFQLQLSSQPLAFSLLLNAWPSLLSLFPPSPFSPFPIVIFCFPRSYALTLVLFEQQKLHLVFSHQHLVISVLEPFL